jgi:hypothetical protein
MRKTLRIAVGCARDLDAAARTPWVIANMAAQKIGTGLETDTLVCGVEG